MQNQDEIRHFYRALFGNVVEGYVEVRTIRADGGAVGGSWVPLDEADAESGFVEAVQALSADGVNVYYGVATRKRRSGRKGDCALLTVLWSDIDRLNLTREDVLALCQKAGLPEPSMLVFSGGGWHVYWLLDEPVELDGAKGERTRHVEAINRGLARLLGGDETVWNADRILRPPGTVNYPNAKKRERDGRVPTDVRLVICEPDRRYAVGDFAAAASHGVARNAGKLVNYDRWALEDHEEQWIESLADDEGRLGALFRRECCDEYDSDSELDMALADAAAMAIRATRATGCVVEEVLRRSRDEHGARLSADEKHDGYYDLTVGKALDLVEQRRATVKEHMGDDAPEEPLDLLPPGAPPWEAPLWALNEKHAVLATESQVRVTCWIPGQRGYKVLAAHTVSDFKNFYANQFIEFNGDEVPVATVWMEWPERRTAKGVVFDPVGNPENRINLWQGWGVEPGWLNGTWSLLRRLMYEGLCDSNEAAFDYLMRWCAWFTQNPDKQAEVAVVMRAGKGTGKGTLGRALVDMAGAHGYHLTSPGDLLGRFNMHLAQATLVFADEAFWAGDTSAEGRLKALITEPTISAEAKFRDLLMVENRLHVVIAGNPDWVVPASADERRFCVLDVNDKFLEDEEFFIALNRELYEEGGIGALLYDLQAMPLGGWHPRQEVPQTRGLAAQKLASLDPAARWAYEVFLEGSFGEGSAEWPDSIECRRAHALCVDAARKLSRGKPPSSADLGRALRRICPAISLIRPRVGGNAGPRHYDLPPLAECRVAFERWLGTSVEWPA